jgi:hypothetical protein
MDQNVPCGCLGRTKRRADSSRSHCGYSLFATSDHQSSSPLGQRRVRWRTLKLHCRLLPKWGEGIQSIESGSESRIKIFGRLERQGCYVLESRQAISNAELFSSGLFHPSVVDQRGPTRSVTSSRVSSSQVTIINLGVYSFATFAASFAS